MPRVFNTNRLPDKHGGVINDYYQGRLNYEPVTIDNMYNPDIFRTLCELRAYHLPPYFSMVPREIMARLSMRNSPCFGLEDPINAARLERELIAKSLSPIFVKQPKSRACPECGAHKPLLGDKCYVCVWLEFRALYKAWKEKEESWRNIRLPQSSAMLALFAKSNPGPWSQFCQPPFETTKDVETELASLAISAHVQSVEDPINPTSPKKVLLANQLGCRKCLRHHSIENIWLDDLSEWEDGLCPSCQGGEYAHTWHYKFQTCTGCHRTEYDYAIWGLCLACYMQFQNRFTIEDKLREFTSEHGQVAALLIKPSTSWVKFIETRSVVIKQSRLLDSAREFSLAELPALNKKSIEDLVRES